MTDTIWPPDLAETRESKYIVLIQSLRAAVRSGDLPAGHKLPPVRDLAWDLKITPGTVARAYKLAAEEGLVETTVGRGTFVAGESQSEPVVDAPLINTVQDGTLDFRAVRVPDVGQGAVIRDGLRRLGGVNGHAYTDYPTDETDHAARVATVNWIGPDILGRFGAEHVVLGLGAQNSVIMALQSILYGANPVILTESLCYPGVRHAARLLRAQLIGVEMDEEGMRPDRLEEALRKHGGQVLVTSAESHSPTTIRTSWQRRQQIAAIARRYQLQIVEDNCHCITRSDIPSYRAICPERAWYVNSLTKTVSASLRFGYAVVPEGQQALARQVAQSSFYGLPQPMLDLCADLMQSGAAEGIRQKVEARVEAQVRMALNHLGQWDILWRKDVPFVWLRMPQGWRASSFAATCEREGIRIKAADEFAMADGAAPHAVRLGLNTGMGDERYEWGLARLSSLLGQVPKSVDL